MNYIAHLHLADISTPFRVGAILGDFVRGADLSAFPPELQAGIRFHRAIDGFVDRHPGLLQARNHFQRPARRFAGIYLDLAYDVFLAETWADHSTEPLPEFIRRMHRELNAAPAKPADATRFIGRLQRHDLLSRYATWDGAEEALRRVATRFPRPADVISGIPRLRELRPQFRDAFPAIFDEITAFAEAKRHSS